MTLLLVICLPAKAEGTEWYSFQDGNWEHPDTWTTDPSGTQLQGPEDIVPGINDDVIIIDGNSVIVNTNNISVNSLEVRNGTLDLAATSGHNFNNITGEGKIRLSSGNFPDGDASGFNSANKGTVEFYGNSFTLGQELTFNNMVVNMDDNSQVFTMLADITLNGNLTVNRGIFRINDNTQTGILNLIINKNLVVNSNGQIRVGEGDTRDGYYIQAPWWWPWPNLPSLGNYHSIFHQVNIKGDFTNNGSVRFTNLDGPDFQEFADNGAAVVTFTGTSNQSATLNGITDFYNLIVDKGSDQTHILEINSSHTNNFALYGPNNVGNNTGTGFSEENPEIRKALWIRNGTLKLRGAINIPSLTEGNEIGGRGDYTIPAKGKLWIEGASVTVYTTIRIDAQRPSGTTWHKDGSGHTALTVFGSFRIDQGFFGTRHSAGFVYRSEDAATVKINGGIIDAAAFRSSGAGGGGRTYYYQAGGQVRVRGNRTYDGEVGGEISGAYPAFGIIYPEGVFTMSGGEILMIGRSRADDNNAYGNNGFYVASEDYYVTGGKVRLLPTGGDNYFLYSTANLWNLEIERISGDSELDVRFTHKLTVSNDLLIGDHCTLHPRRDVGETIYDLNIGRNFTLGQSTNSNAGYEGFRGNTTKFFGEENANITITNNEDDLALKFYTLEIDKLSEENIVAIISEGRDPADVETTPYESPIEIQNRLFVNKGTLDYNSFSIIIGGDHEVENRGKIGLIDDPGFLAMSFNNEQTINVPQGTNPSFGRLVIDNSDNVMLSGGAANITIGDLHMRRGILDIDRYGIVIENDIHNIAGGGSFDDFGENKMIRTAGKHSDRGITRKIDGPGTYLFPLGVDTKTGDGDRYTPAVQEFTDDVEDYSGYSQINNVDNELPTLAESNQSALQYYWRLRNSEFNTTPKVINSFYFYNMPASYRDGEGNPNSWEPGKIVNLIRKYNVGDLSYNNPTSLLTMTYTHQDAGMAGESPPPLEAGEFTTGHSNRFAGEVRVFYLYQNGNWNNSGTWSTTRGVNVNSYNDYPQKGDIAVIRRTADSYSGIVNITQAEESAKVVFDAEHPWHSGSPRVVFSNDDAFNSIFPVVEIALTHEGGLDGINDGERHGAVIQYNLSETYSGEFPEGDFGDFYQYPNALVIYQQTGTTGTRDLSIDATEYPQLWFQTPDAIYVLPEVDILVHGRVILPYNIQLHLNSGDSGDLIINKRFDIGHNGESFGPGQLVFPGDASSDRTVTVLGDINLNRHSSHSPSYIRIENATGGGRNHKLVAYSNINMTDDCHIDLGDGNSANSNVSLIFKGTGNHSLTASGNASVNLSTLNLNKGLNQESSFTFNWPFTIVGPTDGNSDQKAIQMENGKLIFDHPDIEVIITSGGEPFVIPSTSGLVISQGKTNATGSNVNLRGLLRIENDGEATIDNTLLYSSTGQSRIEITDDAILNVGDQIRSTTANEGGVLKYHQSGGTVIVGTNNPDEGLRGVFEVFNPNSEFYMTGGTLTLAQSQGASPARAALYLDPNFYSISDEAVITIGHNDTEDDTIELDVVSTVMLPSLNTKGSNVTARLRNNSLTISGNLNIDPTNAFDGNDLNLTVNGNLLNAGSPVLNTDSLILSGAEQIIDGSLELKHFVVNPSTSVTLEAFTNIEVSGNLYLNSGTFYGGENTVTVQTDVYNYAIFNSDPIVGGLKLAGDGDQRIFGHGTFGRLEIDNTEGVVSLLGHTELENNLILTNGNLNISRFQLTLGFNSEIEGGAFGVDRMIITDGVYESRGLAKRITAGSGDFTFPIGVQEKYTPVELSYTANNNPGLISVTPVNDTHMTATGLDVLDYHWYIESENLSGFTGELQFHYHPADVNGNAEEYWAARLEDYQWAKFPPEFVFETENYFEFEYTGVSNLTGDYTAGLEDHIPDEIARYISVVSGDWTTGSNWRHAEDGTPAPNGGPAGVIVEIEPGHTITINENRRIAYDMETYGILDLGETYGHNFREVRGDGVINIESNTLPAGRFDDFFNNDGSTMVYGGEGNYTITSRYDKYHNFTITGSGEKTLPDPPPDNNFTVYGDLSIEQNATIKAIDENTLEIHGNLSRSDNAGYDVNHWTYLYGSSPQTITGGFTGDSKINKLYVRNSFGVVLDSNVEVNNNLYLRNGIVTVNPGYKLHLLDLEGINLETMDNLEQSWIEGEITRRLGSGTYSADSRHNFFPIGKNSKTRFVRIDDISVHNQDWSAEYFDDSPPFPLDEENTEGLERLSDAEYWIVEGPADGEAKVQLNWGPESGVSDDEIFLESTVVAMWDDSENKWINQEGSASFTNAENTKGYVLSGNRIGFSSKHLTIATTDSENPLPVELLYFQAEAINGNVHLQWATASEVNNDFFTIQRSRDGENFENIQNLPSKAEYGFSNSVLFYDAMDKNAYEGISYYRLKQTDFDGSYDYSDIVSVNIKSESIARLNLFPNPNRGDRFYLNMTGFEPYEVIYISILNVFGNKLHSEVVNACENGNKNHEIIPHNLDRGVYFVITNTRSGRQAVRMVVQ